MKRKPYGYWNSYENCFEEARKCKTRSEFKKSCKSGYQSARKNGWLKDYDWLVDGRVKLFTDKIDCVYYYYFEQTHSIYVGRTVDKKRRDKEHTNEIDRDTVAKYAYENGFKVPEMVIIEDNLTLEEGQRQEEYWRCFYKKHGYNVLNRCKGGALGSIGFGKWTKKEVFRIAKNYTTKIDFRNDNGPAYAKALEKGWTKEMDWFTSGYINHINKSKPVLQYTKDGHIVKEYPSIQEASRETELFASQICCCCNGKLKTAGGYIWRYKDDSFDKYNIKTNYPTKKIKQYTKDGQFVAEYESIKEASKQNGIHKSSISFCCKGNRKSAGGFKWRYAS